MILKHLGAAALSVLIAFPAAAVAQQASLATICCDLAPFGRAAFESAQRHADPRQAGEAAFTRFAEGKEYSPADRAQLERAIVAIFVQVDAAPPAFANPDMANEVTAYRCSDFSNGLVTHEQALKQLGDLGYRLPVSMPAVAPGQPLVRVINPGVKPTSPPYGTQIAVQNGDFKYPHGMAVDHAGNLFVADGHGVKEVLAAGGYVTVKTLGGADSGLKPTAVAVDAAANVFVTDTTSHLVSEIPAAGGYATVKTLAAGHGAFSGPEGIAVDRHGNVFFAESGRNAVIELPAAGHYTEVVPVASANGDFKSPVGVAIDRDDNLFVGDRGNYAIKEILTKGGYVTVRSFVVGTEQRDGPGWLAVDRKGNVFFTCLAGFRELPAATGYKEAQTVWSPTGVITAVSGVAVDAHDAIFLSDIFNNWIAKVPAGG